MKNLVWLGRGVSFGMFFMGLVGVAIILVLFVLVTWAKYSNPYQGYISGVMIVSFLLIYIGTLGIDGSYKYLTK